MAQSDTQSVQLTLPLDKLNKTKLNETKDITPLPPEWESATLFEKVRNIVPTLIGNQEAWFLIKKKAIAFYKTRKSICLVWQMNLPHRANLYQIVNQIVNIYISVETNVTTEIIITAYKSKVTN